MSEIEFEIPEGYRIARELKSKRMQLLVRPATYEAIKKESKMLGISMNELVNDILEEELGIKIN